MIASTRRKHKSVARKFLCVLMVDAQMFGSRSQPRGPRIRQVCARIDDKKRVCPRVTGRTRAVNPAHPSAPARPRAGGLEWRRIFGSPRLGDPAFNDEAMRPGQAWVRVRRNRLSCSRDRSRRGGDRSGGRPPEALADGKGMATALEALDLPDLTNRRLRALRFGVGKPATANRRAARGTSPRADADQPLRRAPLARNGVAKKEMDARPSSPDKLASNSCRSRRPRGTPRGANRRGMEALPTRNQDRMRVRPTGPLHAQKGRMDGPRR